MPVTTTSTVTTTTITSTYKGEWIKLFCFSLAREGYEMDIIRMQFNKYAGIYACDDTAVVSFGKISIGFRGKEEFFTLPTPTEFVGRSEDGTAGNALQFQRVWETVKGDMRYANNDWTVKVDPDAVLLPDRLKMHLVPQGAGGLYIRNCDAPRMQETMMFGALEVISKTAMISYADNHQRCVQEMPWQSWGEDKYMMRCLEHLGNGYAQDFQIIQDGVCKGVWCGDGWAAAFHPMKSVPAWESCWQQAISAR
jgi:hypothetical protein